MAEHLQGQDVTVRVTKDGKIIAALTAVQSFELTLGVQSQELSFLGERAPRIEETPAAGTFRMAIRHRDSSYLTLLQAIQARAQHRTPGIVFSISCKLAYPNGERPTVLIRDVGFDNPNLNAPGQAEFATSDLSGKFREITKITGAGAL